MYGISGLFGTNSFSYGSYRMSSYRRLMQSQYTKNQSVRMNSYQQSRTSRNTSVTASSYRDVIKSTESLVSDATKLSSTGKGNVFGKIVTRDEKGRKVENYDVEKIYNTVKDFVRDYNKVVDDAMESGSQPIKGSVSNMALTTRIMSGNLSQIGINLGSDGKLTLDESQFKNSDMNQVKNLFNGSDSYGAMVGTASSRISGMAAYQSRQNQTGYRYYGRDGLSASSLYGSSLSSYRNSFSNYMNYYSMFDNLF